MNKILQGISVSKNLDQDSSGVWILDNIFLFIFYFLLLLLALHISLSNYEELSLHIQKVLKKWKENSAVRPPSPNHCYSKSTAEKMLLTKRLLYHIYLQK